MVFPGPESDLSDMEDKAIDLVMGSNLIDQQQWKVNYTCFKTFFSGFQICLTKYVNAMAFLIQRNYIRM